MADAADITAVYDYVRAQRPKIGPAHPNLKAAIEAFESWYQGLGWTDWHVYTSDTFNEAKRKREAVNVALSARLPDTWVPADAPQTPPPPPPPGPFISTPVKVAAVAAATLAIVGIVASKLRLI